MLSFVKLFLGWRISIYTYGSSFNEIVKLSNFFLSLIYNSRLVTNAVCQSTKMDEAPSFYLTIVDQLFYSNDHINKVHFILVKVFIKCFYQLAITFLFL